MIVRVEPADVFGDNAPQDWPFHGALPEVGDVVEHGDHRATVTGRRFLLGTDQLVLEVT